MNIKEPLVSVIVNFHNSEKFIQKCLVSILNQDYTNLEIILFDNFSSDNSKNIIDYYKDSRIKYHYSNKKKTLYEARNEAILKSKGDLIAFLDSDDWWEKNYLSSRRNFFLSTEYDFFYSNVNMIYEKKNKKVLYKKFHLPKGNYMNIFVKITL